MSWNQCSCGQKPLIQVDIELHSFPTPRIITTTNLISKPHKVRTNSSTAKISFLSLPREIRDMIYRHAFVSRAPIRPRPHCSSPFTFIGSLPRQKLSMLSGICLVNKQIEKETAEVLYGLNTFHFSSPREITYFEERIGERKRNLVRAIDIYTTLRDWRENGDNSWVTVFRKLRMNNVRRIVVDVCLPSPEAGEERVVFGGMVDLRANSDKKRYRLGFY
jgi:hypothetical protein